MAAQLIIFEDEHLLVINKPAGWNTHSPSEFAGEGIYEWLKNREPRWADLAIIHRLDKETSGAIVFGKTPLANRSLTRQFTERKVRKKYLALTCGEVRFENLNVESVLVRAGDRYLSRPVHSGGERAETRFKKLKRYAPGKILIEAEPLTGKTHQIRVHAAANGFPILGDTLYGGDPAARVFLHAAEIEFEHPGTGKPVMFLAPKNFAEDPRLAMRLAFIDPQETNAYRLIHGASDGWPGWHVDRLGDYLLSQSSLAIKPEERETLDRLRGELVLRGAYHKILNRRVRQLASTDVSPQWIAGEVAPDEFLIRENGVQFALSFAEGYSVGLFLDQRENRRRLRTQYLAPGFFLGGNATGASQPGLEVLNTFSYTCGFSVCAAKAGGKVVSLDLSKKYLDWGKRNFALNHLDSAGHEFIFGDAIDWMRRLAKRKRQFDVIILDPPTFSNSKEQGTFRAEKDYGKLTRAALPLLKSGGVLLCSTNAADFKPEMFLDAIVDAVNSAQRKIVQQHYVPQPPDFPISHEEPAYLKTAWLKIL